MERSEFSKVYESVMELLSQDDDGTLEELLEDILKWEEEHPPRDDYDGFEWYEVHGEPRTLNRLVTHRVLRVVFKSNKCIMYRVTDVEAVKKALSDHKSMFKPLEEVKHELPPDLFSCVVGHEDKKELLLRGLRSDRPVHYLLWGTPASAKSLMAEELARLPNSKFILGSALTRAGLLDVIFTEKPTYIILDEIDKIEDAENLSALLSLMERGLVTETKYRRQRTIRLKSWVIATANDISKLPRELLSRFTILRFRDYSDQEFMEVVVNVLSKREGVSEPLALYIADKVLRILGSRDVRDAIKVARLLGNKKDRNEVDRIIELLRRQR